MTLNGAFKSTTYTLTAGNIKNISVVYSFGMDIKSDSYTITTSETLISNPSSLNTTGTAVTNQEGPYLYQEIRENPSILYINGQTFSVSAYISNLMGSEEYDENNTAFNEGSGCLKFCDNQLLQKMQQFKSMQEER
jgi:hypothetical protein